MTPSMFLERTDLIPSSRSLWMAASSLFLFASFAIVSSAVGLAVDRRQFDMHGPIAAQAVVERNEDALQQRILLSQCLSGMDRLSGASHARTCTDRLTGRPATPRRRGKLDRRVVDHPLELARGAPGTDEGMVSLDGDMHGRTHRCAALAVAREQYVLLASKAFECWCWVGDHVTSFPLGTVQRACASPRSRVQSVSGRFIGAREALPSSLSFFCISLLRRVVAGTTRITQTPVRLRANPLQISPVREAQAAHSSS